MKNESLESLCAKYGVSVSTGPVKDGLAAEFHPNGDLASLAEYRDGEPTRWLLQVNADRTESHVEQSKLRRYVAGVPLGDWGEETMESWEDRWVDRIVQYAQSALRCSFCGNGAGDVRLIAGDDVAICSECVELTHELLHPED